MNQEQKRRGAKSKLSAPLHGALTPMIAGLAFFALVPLTHAACTQTCTDDDGQADSIFWGTSAGGTGEFEMGIGEDALNGDTGEYNTAIGNQAMASGNSADYNTAVGDFALAANTTGYSNVAVGMQALNESTTGSGNTAVGNFALAGYDPASTTGSNNTAIGWGALSAFTTGSNNTAEGYEALFTDTTGNSNVADGYAALYFNKTGSFNTATGRGALYKNTASNNTATGYQSLNKNTSGTGNTAIGNQALLTNTTSGNNTATGYESLYHSTGTANTANGQATLYSNTTGSTNTALGSAALYENTTGSTNIAIGGGAGFSLTTGSNNIDIANVGVSGESTTVRLGTVGTQTNTYIAGISGVTVAGGIGVIVDSSGHLGTSTSSARYKENIQPMEKASEAILDLKPVTFRYKKELDSLGIPQFGLVAEDVAKVDPDLVARDSQGKPYSVRYEAVNAMLLNEFLKEHRKIEEQSRVNEVQARVNQQQTAKIDGLEKLLAEQQRQIKALTAGLEKVNAHLAATKTSPRLVTNE